MSSQRQGQGLPSSSEHARSNSNANQSHVNMADDTTAAANAEAQRLARELGVASTTVPPPSQQQQSSWWSSQQQPPPPRSDGTRSPPKSPSNRLVRALRRQISSASAASSQQSGSQLGQPPPQQQQPFMPPPPTTQPASTATTDYHSWTELQQQPPSYVPPPVAPPAELLSLSSSGGGGSPSRVHPANAAAMLVASRSSGGGSGYHQKQLYQPVELRTRTPSILSDENATGSSHNDSDTSDVYVYDCHGQRAPYKDGPFMIHRDPEGRVIRRRWYGRLEHGYLAWSSIYLHEYFGFTIYTPLTEEEEFYLKQQLDEPSREGSEHPGGEEEEGGGAFPSSPKHEPGQIPAWICQFSSLPTLAIPMSYFCIGVALQLLRTPLIVYFIEDLNATAAEVNVLFTVMAVPWCFKVLYGFLSDCLPISGLRRKPYFMTGWVVYIVSNLILMITPFPSIQLCILLVFAQTAGYMLADVMTDALIVERSRFETTDTRGTMQSKGYIIRFFGSTIGAAIGAVVYNKDDWNWYLPIRLVFFINAAFPMIFLLPVVPYLLELENNCHPKNFILQCKDLFHTAQLRAVWQPMTFVYIYNALQLTNAAWMNFLVEGLDFSAWQIGIVGIAGSIMAWFGIMTYKRFFFASNWRIVYFWCTTLASAIALGQLILVFGINRTWGIPDIWFSMGDDVLVEFIIAVQFLPMCIMYLGLCPPGSEGTTYAMLTTWSNLAGSLAFDISTALTVVWDVSSATIAAGDYEGVWKLSLLCGLIGPVPLILLGLIPKNKQDQRRLQKDKKRHYWHGVAFIAVMLVTLVITFVESVYEVYFNDESDDYDNQRQRRLSRLLVGH